MASVRWVLVDQPVGIFDQLPVRPQWPITLAGNGIYKMGNCSPGFLRRLKEVTLSKFVFRMIQELQANLSVLLSRGHA